MKLITTFFGDDLRFEGDLPLTLRALPAGARVTRAAATVAPAASAIAPATLFDERFDLDSAGRGPFGVSVQSEADTVAVIDLGGRRTLRTVVADGMAAISGRNNSQGGAFVQIDMGGLWATLDTDGNLTLPTTAQSRRRFEVDDTTSPSSLRLPGLAGQRFRLSNGATDDLRVTSLALRSYPSNLTLRLGDLGPVWFKVGDLRAAITTPDFGPILDAFLQRTAPTDGVYTIPFLLHSDGLARLRLTLELEYHLTQPLLPPPLSQAVFTFGYAALPEAEPAPLRALLPLNARPLPGATAAQVGGRFEASRVAHGPVRGVSFAHVVAVAPGFTVAHPIKLSTPATIDAIDLPIESVTPATTLLVTLQEDVGGKPWGPSLFAEPVQVEVARPAAGGARWASAPLVEPFTFHPGVVYWLVVTAAEGEARWAVESAGALPPLQRTTDAGLSYRQARATSIDGPVAGIYRLRHAPASFRQPIKLDVAGHEVGLGAYDALGKVDFRLDLPEVATAIEDALTDAASAQADLAERIVNGDFARWTRYERRARRRAAAPLALPFDRTSNIVVASDAGMIFIGGVGPASQGLIQAVVNAAPLHLGDDRPIGGTAGGTADFTLAPRALAGSPGAEFVYALAERPASDEAAPIVLAFAARRDETPRARPLAEASGADSFFLGADPGCRFVYAAYRRPAGSDPQFPATITRLETSLRPNSLTESLDAAEDTEFVRAFLVAADGRRAYLAVDQGIAVVDLEGWRAIGTTWGAARPAMVSLGTAARGGRLVGLALSPDGARLYALQEVTPPGESDYRRLREIVVLDATRLAEAAAGERPFIQAVLAVAPLNETPGESFVEWLPVAATPDDTRLVVVADTRARPSEGGGQAWRAYLVDTGDMQVVETVAVPAEPVDLAITPDSGRAIVLTVLDAPSAGPRLHAIELESWSADEWALTAGRAAPFYVPGSTKPSLRLGSPEGHSGLSQVVRVQGGQEYELRFNGRAGAPDAFADLFWLDSSCGRVGELELPIDDRCSPGLWPHRARATAPAGADRAELRFRQAFGGFAIVDDVSLAAPTAALQNGDFSVRAPAARPDNPAQPLQNPDGTPALVPAGWNLAPADLPASLVLNYLADGQAVLRAVDARPAVLSQMVSLAANLPVLLEVHAHPFGPAGSQPATVELRWTNSAAAPLQLPFDPQQFDALAIQAAVPADATGAELAIVQPPGGALALRRVQVSQPVAVEIPLTFLAEAPGELAVSGPVVAYDVGGEPRPTPPQPPVPLGCTPTPPEDVPLPPGGPPRPGKDLLAEPERASGYCPCCENIHVLDEPEVITSACGMTGVAGRCPNEGARVVVFPARGW